MVPGLPARARERRAALIHARRTAMSHRKLIATLLTAVLVAGCAKQQSNPRAEVIHWWTSGGESAAVNSLADAYRAAGGEWVDSAVALGEQARAVTVNRIVGGNPPTVAQFNTTRQFQDLARQGVLANVDTVAAEQGWDRVLPRTLLDVIRVDGHFYAAPVDIHMLTWVWYSKAAFGRAGIASEPKSFDELIAALDRLKAAGVVPLALGGQPWQESILFTWVLANVGGRDMYLGLFRDRDPRLIASAEFRDVLVRFRQLRQYVDAGSPGRNWNDATALLITGRAGVQVMGDWAKGEFSAAGLEPGPDYGCIPGFGPASPYVVQGDVFVFPRSDDPAQQAAQRLMAKVVMSPETQVEFSRLKGSIPPRRDVDATRLDECARKGVAIMADPAREVGNGEVYLTPDQNGAFADVVTDYWNSDLPVEEAQRRMLDALGR